MPDRGNLNFFIESRGDDHWLRCRAANSIASIAYTKPGAAPLTFDDCCHIAEVVLVNQALFCDWCGQLHMDAGKYASVPENSEMCFFCTFWEERTEAHINNPGRSFIIDGVAYMVGEETEAGSAWIRGFGGSRFVIQPFHGPKITTTNLWCQGDVPQTWRNLLPDNASFLKN